MAKKNALVDRIDQIRKETFFTTQHFTRQLVMDQAAIILNRDFGFGAERLQRFNAVNVLGSGLMPDGRLVDPSAMDAKMKRWYDSLFGGDSHG